MFAKKAPVAEKEYKNEIMVHDPFFDHVLDRDQRKKIRESKLEDGHRWISFDPAETNVGFRQERRFKDKIVGEKSIRFSIYNHPFEFTTSKKLPNYRFLDEALCFTCGKNASWRSGDQFLCGTHGTAKKYPEREKILHGRKRSEFLNDESKWKSMFEYENIVCFLEHLDLEEVRYVVIERQMAINYRSTRMVQHLITALFFLLRARNKVFAVIYEIDPKIKSRVYGVRLPKPELKKWTLRKAIYNAVCMEEVGFLDMVVQEGWSTKLIQMYKEGTLTESVLWDLVEPERNIAVSKDRAKMKRENCILTKAFDSLYDICDAKEQIESLVVELGLSYKTQALIGTQGPLVDSQKGKGERNGKLLI